MIERVNYWGALRRGWRLLVALALVFAVVAVLLPQSKSPKVVPNKYDWRAASYVSTLSTDGISKAGVSSHTILFWANNFYTKGAAIVAAGQGSEASQLLPHMKASTVGAEVATRKLKIKAKKKTTTGTTASKKNAPAVQVVQLLVGGSSADQSVKLANAYSTAVQNAVNKAYADYLAGLTKQQLTVKPNASSGFVIVAPALASHATMVVTKVHSGTKLGRKELGLIGLGVGLLLGVVIVLARELLQRTVQTTAGTEASFLYPVVAEIPEHEGSGGHEPATVLAVVDDPASPAAEAYRMLRMSLLFEGLADVTTFDDPYGEPTAAGRPVGRGAYQAPEPGGRQVVLVVSPGEEPSRPILTANLAAAYAEAGERVIVISTRDIDSGRSAGFAGQRTDRVEKQDVVARLEPANLEGVSRLSLRHFVGSGGQLATRAPDILAVVRQLADVVIIETPPLLAVHHGEALIRSVDVVVVVAEARTTRIAHAQRAGEVLRRMGAPVLGVALTNVRLSSRDVRKTAEASGPSTLPELEPAGPLEAIGEATSA